MVQGRRKRPGNSSGMFKRNKAIAMQRADDGTGRGTGICYLCGREGATDGGHIVSYEDGGTDSVENIVPVHGVNDEILVWNEEMMKMVPHKPRCNQKQGKRRMTRGMMDEDRVQW